MKRIHPDDFRRMSLTEKGKVIDLIKLGRATLDPTAARDIDALKKIPVAEYRTMTLDEKASANKEIIAGRAILV